MQVIVQERFDGSFVLNDEIIPASFRLAHHTWWIFQADMNERSAFNHFVQNAFEFSSVFKWGCLYRVVLCGLSFNSWSGVNLHYLETFLCF